MEKKIKAFKIKDLDWGYSIEISRLREDLAEIEKLGATHINIESSVFYDCAELTIEAISERIETDEEFDYRLNSIKKQEDFLRQKELEKLQELKLKYEK